MLFLLIRNDDNGRETMHMSYDADYLRRLADELRSNTIVGSAVFYTVEIDF